MDDSAAGDDETTTVDPTDRPTLRAHLERFAGTDAVSEADDGRLTAEFSASTFVSVGRDGTVSTGMPLHGFEGAAEQLRFDHENGELYVSGDGGTSYTFRRP